MTLFDRTLLLPPLLLWLLGSVAAYALATNLIWLARLLRARASSAVGNGPPIDRWARFRAAAGGALCQAGTFLFTVGVPYLALGGWPRRPLQGLITLQDMGMVGLGGQTGTWPADRWLSAAGTGAGLGLAALAVLLLAWLAANYPARGLELRFAPRPWWVLLVDAVYHQAHWAFYRAALAVLLDDVPLATFAGLGLVYVEWALNPFWRHGWGPLQGTAGRAAAQWLRAALALVTALVFLWTRNLWICLGVHYAIELALWLIPTAGKTHTAPRRS